MWFWRTIGVEFWLEVLERQVSKVVDKTIILDNASATALTPILVVLNKFSVANPAFCKKVKDRIVPPEAEDTF